ncbi:MFS transporter [Schlesneria paludicola]|uniref:MFS transporter n=1 Tax=Schlesneria paludicola TaxID=360056 RepID=UPI0036F2A532
MESRVISSPISRSGWAEIAMGIGGFGIGTGEFVIMGLLPNVAEQMHVSVPEAGYSISAYAVGVVVGAPLISVFGARWPRHLLLTVLMSWFALGNLASAWATDFVWLTVFRFLTGMPHGAYFGVASLVAASLVAPEQRGQAVGRMMLGLTIATVLGVPLATWLGQSWGWRSAFTFVALIGAAAASAIWSTVPRRPADRNATPLRELGALRKPQVLLTLGIGSVGFGGLFCVFSYITPTMVQVAGLPESWMPAVLALFGIGMISGNLLGSQLADRALMLTIGGALIWNIVVIGLFSFSAHYLWLALLNILLIGHGVALVPALQIRLMDVADDAQTLAAALNHSAFNIANALGAWLGGVVITAGYGWAATGWVGAVMALVGMAIFLISAALKKQPPLDSNESTTILSVSSATAASLE